MTMPTTVAPTPEVGRVSVLQRSTSFTNPVTFTLPRPFFKEFAVCHGALLLLDCPLSVLSRALSLCLCVGQFTVSQCSFHQLGSNSLPRPLPFRYIRTLRMHRTHRTHRTHCTHSHPPTHPSRPDCWAEIHLKLLQHGEEAKACSQASSKRSVF